MVICGVGFYLGLQLILIGIWHQKYRFEHPTRKHPKTIEDIPTIFSSRPPGGQNNPYGYSNYAPTNMSSINEKMLLQQSGAVTGGGFFDPVVWPPNVHSETRESRHSSQHAEPSFGSIISESNRSAISIGVIHLPLSNTKTKKCGLT